MTFPTLVFGFGGPTSFKAGLSSGWSVPTSLDVIPIVANATTPECFDRTGNYDNVDYTFTSNRSGSWQHKVSFVVTNSTGSSITFKFWMYNNNVSDHFSTVAIPANSTQTIVEQFSYSLPNGNEAELRAEATGAGLTLESNINTFWTIYKR